MTCQPPGAALDICPTRDEITPQLLALLPRGRAWGTHDGGPYPGSVLYGFWTAVADVWAWVNRRICDLAAEFTCASHVETHDVWMEEYGLPDGCDPFPDLCAKVAAIGGARCEYYTAIAARAGWSITCTDLNNACGVKAANALAGSAIAGKGLPPSVLLITVTLPDSPAHVGGAPSTTVDTTFGGLTPPFAGRAAAGGILSCPGTWDDSETFVWTPVPVAGCTFAGNLLACPPAGEITPPFAGAAFAGGKLACAPDLSALECLMARIVGAHILIIYEIAQ